MILRERQRDLVATAAGRTVIFQSTVCVESPSVRVSFSIGSSPSMMSNTYGVAIEGNGAVSGRCGEEALERSHFQFGREAKCSIDRGVSEAGEGAEQRIAGHGARVVVAAFVFVPRIAGAAVVAAAQSFDDGQALVDVAFRDEVRGDLVFDAGPDLVGVDERQSRLVAARPTAKQKTGLAAHRVTGTLRIGVLTEIGFEVVLEDGLQVGANILRVQAACDSVGPSPSTHRLPRLRGIHCRIDISGLRV